MASVLDVITLHGRVREVVAAISTIKNLLNEMGCTLHADVEGKNKIFCLDPLAQIQSDITRTSVGIEVVGCPIGSDDFIRQVMEQKLDLLDEDMMRLRLISPVFAYPLFKFCVNARLGYLARLIKPWVAKEIFKKYDNMVLKFFKLLFGIERMPTPSIQVLRLPWKQGGMGMMSYTQCSERAWVASFCSAHSMVLSVPGLRSVWSDVFSGVNDWGEQGKHFRLIKKHWPDFCWDEASSAMHLPSQKNLMDSLYASKKEDIVVRLKDENEVAKLAWFQAQCSADRPWLFSAFNGYPVTNGVFLIMVKLSLLLTVFDSDSGELGGRCPCHTSYGDSRVDIMLSDKQSGFHGFYCQEGGMQLLNIARHNDLYLALMRCLRNFFPAASISREHEFQNATRVINMQDSHRSQDRKKADIFLQLGDGRNFAIDVSVVNSVSSKRVSDCVSVAAVIKTAENNKRRQYVLPLTGHDVVCVPFIMDVTGNFGSAALQFLDLLQDVVEQGTHVKQKIKASLSATLARWHLEHITVFNNMLRTQRGALVAPASPAA